MNLFILIRSIYLEQRFNDEEKIKKFMKEISIKSGTDLNETFIKNNIDNVEDISSIIDYVVDFFSVTECFIDNNDAYSCSVKAIILNKDDEDSEFLNLFLNEFTAIEVVSTVSRYDEAIISINKHDIGIILLNGNIDTDVVYNFVSMICSDKKKKIPALWFHEENLFFLIDNQIYKLRC